MQLRLTLTVVVALLVMVVGAAMTGQTAQATVLQIHHKPFSKMNRTEKIHYLKHQKWHDNSLIRWWHHHGGLAASDVNWIKRSLKTVKRNLHK